RGEQRREFAGDFFLAAFTETAVFELPVNRAASVEFLSRIACRKDSWAWVVIIRAWPLADWQQRFFCGQAAQISSRLWYTRELSRASLTIAKICPLSQRKRMHMPLIVVATR
ncbi:MAG: hypothetical protein ACU83O_08060, partial [Gammaproteobacteria bacterium]